jgi:hypothetical protein
VHSEFGLDRCGLWRTLTVNQCDSIVTMRVASSNSAMQHRAKPTLFLQRSSRDKISPPLATTVERGVATAASRVTASLQTTYLYTVGTASGIDNERLGYDRTLLWHPPRTMPLQCGTTVVTVDCWQSATAAVRHAGIMGATATVQADFTNPRRTGASLCACEPTSCRCESCRWHCKKSELDVLPLALERIASGKGFDGELDTITLGRRGW